MQDAAAAIANLYSDGIDDEDDDEMQVARRQRRSDFGDGL